MPHTAPLGARIRDILMTRIVSGHYLPGERLLELKLAAEFGTSQVPVREALARSRNVGARHHQAEARQLRERL